MFDFFIMITRREGGKYTPRLQLPPKLGEEHSPDSGGYSCALHPFFCSLFAKLLFFELFYFNRMNNLHFYFKYKNVLKIERDSYICWRDTGIASHPPSLPAFWPTVIQVFLYLNSCICFTFAGFLWCWGSNPGPWVTSWAPCHWARQIQ